MCGITGIFNLSGTSIDNDVLLRMTRAIAHRGPDGEGIWYNKFVGLGHRRLAIIDLSKAGHQPMIRKVGSDFVALSYNGEIYNFQELRTELEDLGYFFKSRTDSEVVLNAWVEWGKSCVTRFNGMFAFAVWDGREQSLFLVRDRYGIKPLYYSLKANTLLFGSEQKAILQHPQAERKIDKKALLEYFTFQNIFTDRTLLENVKLLPPATIASIKLDTSALRFEQYWDYCFQEPKVIHSTKEYNEELDYLIQQAVNRQLITDVELGSYLSGGMDSGTLTSLASKKLPYIKTFTCGFDLSSASGIELSFDERVKAEAMSALFKTEHYEMVLKAGDMERCLPKIAFHIEEPRVGQSYPNYYMAQLASKFVKVVFSGIGGDELFAGYPWRYYRATGCNGFENYIDKYYLFWQRLIDNKDIKRLFSPIWSDVKDVWTRNIFRDVFSSYGSPPVTPEDYVNQSLYFEAKTFLHGLFVIEDKLSMAHGLETRVPFMDNDLVDFAMQCPVKLKLNNLGNVFRINENEIGDKQKKYFLKTNDGKQILRNVMSKYIPTEITNSEKQGFSSPDASWFKGESIDFVKNKLINNNDAFIYDFLDPSTIKELVNDHLEGRCNRRLFIWSLLNVEEWIKGEFC